MEQHLASPHGPQPQPLILLLILSFSQYALAQGQPYKTDDDSSSPSNIVGLALLGVGAFLLFGCALPLFITRKCLGGPNTNTATTTPDLVNTNNEGVARRKGRGIDPKAIETFPLINYAAVKHMRASNSPLECAICLSEFLDDDTLRLLPGCRHVFHVNCIDTWLADHKTCPVCRSDLSDPKVIAGKRLLSLNIECKDVPCSSHMSEQVAMKKDVPKSKGPRHVQSMTGGWERFTLVLPDDVMKDIKTTHKYRKVVSLQDYTYKGNAGSTDWRVQSFMNSLSWKRQQKVESKVAAPEMSEASNSANISSRQLLAFPDRGESEMLEFDTSCTQIELKNVPVHDRV
ncbi:hypothetical protein FCM35_KLT08101 [Carex littledalei]|uniref:RING-type E3 ubiquitin transferase n=1 Tax=Carex littledalei TaxID=544730 RepID=A0A833V6C2_9POAL|nr:hypothetical protein FCM35_KLT08101 [Carex littledalei]